MRKGTLNNASDEIMGRYEILPNNLYYVTLYGDYVVPTTTKEILTKAEMIAKVKKFDLHFVEDEGDSTI